MLSAPVRTLPEFLSHDYASLLAPDDVLGVFARPLVPLAAVALYLLLSRPVCRAIVRALGLTPKGALLQTLTVCHSALLALYSAWTCFFSVRIVLQAAMEDGFWPTMCGSHESLWVRRGLGFWISHFYVSKYYEFVDTWIILLKQKEPSLLQTFHHAGIAVNMWSLMVTASSPVLVVLCFNSFIHTLMYTYYVMAALNIRSALKAHLTSMQIAQFLVGLALTLQTHFIPGCLSPAQDAALWVMETYTIVLVVLFAFFFAESYVNKDSKAGRNTVDRIASTSEFLSDSKDRAKTKSS